MIDSPSSSLANSGERMAPREVDAPTFWHHIYRYRFAVPFCIGRRVLDVACGEGYGAYSIQKGGAARVIGVDISSEAVRHARARYGIDARVGSAEELPLENGSVDVVVSFETIEHIPSPPRFIQECARVLTRGGQLILSSPNRELYRLRNGINPFHCSELSEPELTRTVSAHFQIEGIYGQYPEMRVAGLLDPCAWPLLPWLRLKGVNAVRLRLLNRESSPLSQVAQALAEDPSEAVLGRIAEPLPALNPNIVRPRPASRHVDFVFLVIVARRKD